MVSIIRFTVKLLSFDRTNALLANLTSGEEGMPADLQGFSLERIRRVGKSCYQRNGHLSPLFKSPSHHYMTIFSLQNYFKTSVKKRIFFGLLTVRALTVSKCEHIDPFFID